MNKRQIYILYWNMLTHQGEDEYAWLAIALLVAYPYPVYELVLMRRLAWQEGSTSLYNECDKYLRNMKDHLGALYGEYQLVPPDTPDVKEDIKNEIFWIFRSSMPSMLGKFLNEYADLSLDLDEDDFVQDALRKAAQKWDEYTPEKSHLWYWIRWVICQRVWLDEYKKLARVEFNHTDLSDHIESPHMSEGSVEIQEWYRCMTSEVLKRNRLDEIKVWAMILDGVDIKDRALVAQLTSLPVNTITNCRRRLRRIAEKICGNPPAHLEIGREKQHWHICMTFAVLARDKLDEIKVWVAILDGVNPMDRDLIAELTNLDKSNVNGCLRHLRCIARGNNH